MNVLLLPMACLPQDDLESYSRAWESRPALSNPDAAAHDPGAPLDASLGSGGAPSWGGSSAPNGGSGSSVVDAGDAGVLVADAGVEPGEPGEPDASSGAELDASAAPPADASAAP